MYQQRRVCSRPQSGVSLGQPPSDRLSKLEIVVGVDRDDGACRFGSVSESRCNGKRPTVSEEENANGLDAYIYPTPFPEFLHEFKDRLIGPLLVLEGVSRHVRGGTNKLGRT